MVTFSGSLCHSFLPPVQAARCCLQAHRLQPREVKEAGPGSYGCGAQSHSPAPETSTKKRKGRSWSPLFWWANMGLGFILTSRLGEDLPVLHFPSPALLRAQPWQSLLFQREEQPKSIIHEPLLLSGQRMMFLMLLKIQY